MPRSTASRKYQLTINNPKEHGFDHAAIKSALVGLSGCVYWCMCDEIGEHGTPHTHVYVAFKNAKEFHSLHRRFYGEAPSQGKAPRVCRHFTVSAVFRMSSGILMPIVSAVFRLTSTFSAFCD